MSVKIQLPDLLVEIDRATRFSWLMLGRPARSEQELIVLYAGLIGLGSDPSAADIARMTLNIPADAVAEMMKRIEANDRLHDPRRRMPAIGTYIHIFNQWPIFPQCADHSQPPSSGIRD